MDRATFLRLAAALSIPGGGGPLEAKNDATADTVWHYRAAFQRDLAVQIPGILKTQDPHTGRFGSGVWIVNDQNALFPLAVAWALPYPGNPHHHDAHLLEAIMAGGDALIDAQDKNGRWVFRKKDNSTWGDIYMPWTYSRWIRAYSLIREAMPPERRARWEKALTLGYSGISANELEKIHNIPTHHAMGLYIAGEALGPPEWKTQATAFLHRVAASQDPGGFWSENSGPVVGYNYVYSDALGVYYGLTRDPAILPALARAARFHAAITYPDGSAVETVDERQLYHPGVSFPNVGFAFTPEGRGYARQQAERLYRRGKAGDNTPRIGAEAVASFLLYGEEGPAIAPPGAVDVGRAVLGHNDALMERRRPWFVAMSAYHAPMPQSRWIQDRQNLVSLFHDGLGLLIGGGNSKLTPLWSTFTVGDTARLFHKPGDENPDFTPPTGLFHVPADATLEPEAGKLILAYGKGVDTTHCEVSVTFGTDVSARLTYACDFARSGALRPVAGHVPLLAHPGADWRTASGKSGKFSAEPLHLSAAECGGWLEVGKWRVTVPPDATLQWPVLPHDQYVKDGQAALALGKLVLTLPLSPAAPVQTITVTASS